MIPTKVDRDIIRGGEFEEVEMGVEEGSESFIFNVLRNSLYKDKIGSPLREYVANALDEHVKAGKTDVPVVVHFPTAFSNELRVRDFGAGLTDENVIRFFSKYGASDKRNSNKLIGAYGLGCKSAFAYTDAFSVISFKDGKKTTFSLYIDETEKGKVAKLHSEDTDEPNGVEIVIPVKPTDVSTFVSRGLALMKYFKTLPEIRGIANVPDFSREVSPVSGDNWKYFGDDRGSVVIQGQIGYPIDADQMGEVAYYAKEGDVLPTGKIHQWEYNLLNSGLEIEVPIGAVEVTASREELQMTPKTIKAVRKRLAEIRQEIVDLVSAKFVNATNLVEAKTAYYNFFQKGGSFGATLHDSVGTIVWNGQTLTNNVIILKGTHKVMQYTRKHNGDIVLNTHDKIQCSDDLNLYFDDTDRKLFMYKRRAKTLLDAGAKQVTVIQTDDEKAFLSETGLDIRTLPKYSSVQPTVLASTRLGTGNGVDAAKRIKHKVKVFELDWTKLKSGSVSGAKSDYWKVAEIEIDTQVFVPIDRFEPVGLFSNSLKTMKAQLKELELLGIDISATPIYGIKAGIKTGNMISLDKWALEKAKSIPTLADDVAMIRDWKTRKLFSFQIAPKGIKAGSFALEYRKEYLKVATLMKDCGLYFETDAIKARLNLANLIELDVPNEGKLVALSDRFRERYPMIPLINAVSIHGSTQSTVVDYINMVDAVRDAEASAVAMAAAA